jgi:hypothetical protein
MPAFAGEGTQPLGQRNILRTDAPPIAERGETRAAHPPQLTITPAVTTGTGLATAAQGTGRHTPVMVLATVEAATTDRHRGRVGEG